MKVLAINSYAGSLLVAAKTRGLEVTGSYEDCGFGQAHQRANFPGLDFRSTTGSWPRRDLSGEVAIAHPPCAAFSIQGKGNNLKAGKFGLDSDHFKQTRSVLEYALGHRVIALAVESVPGALDGARTAHDEVAARHGYEVYRLLQNAATFGLPQWRPRFWCVFVRADVLGEFAVWHEPVYRSVSEVLDSEDPGPPDEHQELALRAQKWLLEQKGVADPALFERPGMLARNLQVKLGGGDLAKISTEYCIAESAPECIKQNPDGTFRAVHGYSFVSRTCRVLDPDGVAPVVMRDSWFLYRGRTVTPAEYRAIMGFPRDYALDKNYRLWLSKGVCPPVAAWVLELIERNLAGDVPPGARWLQPGEVADFGLTKALWKDRGVPPAPEPHDPHLMRKPRAARLLGPDARVVLSGDPDEAMEAEPLPDDFSDGDPVQRDLRPDPPRKSATKKRAEREYTITAEQAIEPAVLEEAFRTKKELVLPTLKSYDWVGEPCDTRGCVVHVVAQYEPPNKGGNRNDVDRLVARAAKALEAAGLGRVTVVGGQTRITRAEVRA